MLSTRKHPKQGLPHYFDVILAFELSESEIVLENASANPNLESVPFAKAQIKIRGERKMWFLVYCNLTHYGLPTYPEFIENQVDHSSLYLREKVLKSGLIVLKVRKERCGTSYTRDKLCSI